MRTAKKEYRDNKDCRGAANTAVLRGFTLIEFLVVIFIITVGMGILMPAAVTVRRRARNVLTMGNQHQIVIGLNSFASDHNGRYPESVATIGQLSGRWNWQGPNMLISYKKRSAGAHRAVSEYLGSHIKDSRVMFCPNGPRKYEWFEQAWKQGDEWDNPDTVAGQDLVIGTYCFYWNYVGYIDEGKVFKGPRWMSAEKGRSGLLVSDYFGYGNWRNPKAYFSCEKLEGSSIVGETAVSHDPIARGQVRGIERRLHRWACRKLPIL